MKQRPDKRHSLKGSVRTNIDEDRYEKINNSVVETITELAHDTIEQPLEDLWSSIGAHIRAEILPADPFPEFH